MRDRHIRYQFVTYRRLIEQIPDSLGDTSIVMPDNRESGFRVKLGITWTNRKPAESDKPGRKVEKVAFGLLRNRDIPPEIGSDYEPKTNDLIELVVGDKLFVIDVQPAFQKRRSLGHPDGGWDGWRLVLTDRQPVMSAATQYE